MRLLIGLLVFLFVAAGPREAAAQSAPKCPAGARLAATPPGLDKLTISAQPGAARVGEPVTVAWSLPGVQRSAARRAYLVVLVPDAARVDGAGFFALRPGAPNPAGMSFGRDRTRAIVPLHTAFADASGKIEILPFEAGPLALEWAVVATDGCAEAVAANGRLAPMMITGGRPRLVLRDEFSARQPERTIRANNGPFEVRVYKGQFEVFDTATGVLVLRRDGSEPTFSPTGRFLTAKTPLGETFEALDLVSGRVIGRYETSRLHWSHADSFLWFEDEHVSKMQIVRTLHGRRHELTQHVATRREAKYERVKAGLAKDMDEEAEDRRPRPPTVDIEPEGTTCSRGCYAREDWQLELSLDHGMAIFLDTRVGRENPALLIILVYDLGAGRENALFVRGAKGRADFKARFGFDLPALKGWRIGDKLATTVIPYAYGDEKKLIVATGRDVRPGAAAASSQKVAARATIPRNAQDTAAIAATGVIGAQLVHLPTTAPANLRAGRDTAAIAAIEQEIARLYKPAAAMFAVKEVDNTYSSGPFPDPAEAPQDEPIKLNLTAPGRDLWRWSDGGTTYWLTQGLASNHLTHTYTMSLVARTAAGATRHANLIRAANDPEAKFVYHKPAGEKVDYAASDGIANIVPDGPYALFSLGDMRTHLETAFGDPSVVTLSGGRYLAVLTKPVARLLIFDLQRWRFVCGVVNPIDGTAAVSVIVHASGRHVTQINDTGIVQVYACPSGEAVLNGAYVDDELVVMDRHGHFDGSADAAGYVHVTVEGLPGRHLLAQFDKVLRRPGLAADVLAGRELSPPILTSPPVLRALPGAEPGAMRLEAASAAGLDHVRLFADGRLLRHVALAATTGTVTLARAELQAVGSLTAIAVDKQGLASAPLTLPGGGQSAGRGGQLHLLAVGVDRYPGLGAKCGTTGDQTCDLAFAAADARRIGRALSASARYAKKSVTVLIDAEATAAQVLGTLDTIIARAASDDTIVVSFAGHGLSGAGNGLQLGLSATELDRLEQTSLGFDAISALLKKSRARVIVLLDVCHAGLADNAAVASNDAAVSRLVTDSGASMIVFSASKGRQFSQETPVEKGGQFSLAFERILTTDRRAHDTDGNGAISVSELYRGLKSAVVRETGGSQTPWLSRNLIVGDFDLF